MFSFPWSNFHELNLDWILSVVKEAKEIFVKGEGDIQHAVETADQALETAEQAAAGVIADGSVTIPKVNDEVFNLMAFIVSGSVNPVAIPAGSLVILRKSTVYNVSDGIYVAASDIPASSILTAADLLQPSPLPDAGGLNYVMSIIGDTETSINAIQRGLVTVVDGDTATSAVPVGALAYLKNNTHDLQEGIYANISNAPFPTSGGTADSTVFSAVPNVLNSLKSTSDQLETIVTQLDQNMAYVESGNTASRTYSAGEFISWLGLLYKASTSIPQGTAFASGTNLTPIYNTGGGMNNLRLLFEPLNADSTEVIAAGGEGTVNFSDSVPSGYRIVGVIPTGTGGTQCFLRAFVGTTAYYHNFSSGSINIGSRFSITALLQKV